MIAQGKKLVGNYKDNIVTSLKIEFRDNEKDVVSYEKRLKKRVHYDADAKLEALKNYAYDLFGMSAQKIYSILEEFGVCYKSSDTHYFTSNYEDKGYGEVKSYYYPTRKGWDSKEHLYFTIDGFRLIWVILQKKKNLEKDKNLNEKKSSVIELSLFDDQF